MSEYSTRVANLSRAKLQLLAKQLKKREEESRALVTVRRRADADSSAPLSFAQERLWFLDQMNPGDPSYNVSCAVRLDGDLDARALELSLGEIVRRHEILRTNLVMRAGRATQIIHDYQPLMLPLVDLSGLPEARRLEVTKSLAFEDDHRPFDLARGPLLRTCLLKLDRSEHVLLLSMHHVVADAWSMGVVVRELSALYEAFSTGKPSPLPELSLQYADFAVWQRDWLKGEVFDSQFAYWKEHLGSSALTLELPTDKPRPAFKSSRGDTQRLTLSRELSAALSSRCQQMQVTPFIWLLSALNVLLYRYTGREDLVVGTPIACRNRSEIEQLIGFFVNTLVMRADLSGKPSFRDVVARVRDAALGAYAHQDMPLEKLVEQLQPDRGRSRQPLFQVVFSMQNAPLPDIDLRGLSLQVLESPRTTSKFDLLLLVNEGEEGLACGIEYDTDLFEAVTIRRMLGHFKTLMEMVIENPDLRIADLSLLSAEERREVVVEWNETEAEYPRERCIHELFEVEAVERAEQVAVVSREQRVSYGELNARANQLARYLRDLGVGPGSRIGIYLQSSIEMIVALAATLKAGAAYVPLEPDHPRDRLSFIVEDAAIQIILSAQHLAQKPLGGNASIIRLDSDWEKISRESEENVESGVTPEDLAYVIYTSGTTGRPKGVKIQHRALVNYIWWASRVYLQGERLNFALYSTLAFDLTATSIFTPLVTGNSVVIHPQESRGGALEGITSDESLGVVKLTPSHLKLIKNRDNSGSKIKRLIVGGEALETELARQVQDSFGRDVEIFNEYGPTEATVGCMIYKFDRERDERAFVPIGRPAANSRIYILDDQLRPLAENEIGEMYISGDGLAQGYLNREELTAERFVDNPFEAGKKMYRTGDLARRLASGEIDYVGRRDEQVKFHGYRVELLEIKSALNTHPKVRDSVIVVRDDGQGSQVMVAYYVSREPLEAGELRAHLKTRVIEETIPNLFVHLKRLPLTVNGKVDFDALPDIKDARGKSARRYRPARTPVEEVLASVWAELLGASRVGIDDNFFELGGHSLLATQVMSRVSEAFNVSLPLRHLFESPTVAGLAQSVERAIREGRGVNAPAIQAAPRDGELPLSFAQSRLWFLNQLEPESPVYNVGSGLRLSGDLNPDALERTLREVIDRHEVLRTTFASDGGRPVQVISRQAHFELPLIDLSALPAGLREREIHRLVGQESRRIFDLAEGPLLRASLLRLDEREHVLLLSTHHIVSDQWSVGVLIREMAHLYESFSKGQPPSLPPLPIQYADYAKWQRDWLQGEALEAQLSYWRDNLAHAPGLLELPSDKPRNAVQSFKGARRFFKLPAELSGGLQGLALQTRTTLYMVLLATFKTLLSRYSGQKDILVGTPIANRNHLDIEGLIGFFVNTLVMRTDLSGDPSFRELLDRVKETALAAYAHQDLPFERLVEELQPDRSTGNTPLFQALFTLQNAPMQELALPGLTIKPLEQVNDTAKFDLILNLWQEEQGMSGVIEYNTDRLDASTIERMLGSLMTLLEAVAANPEQSISRLPLLSAEERKEVVVEWNATEAEYPRERCIHELFEVEAVERAEQVAVVSREQRVSYGELNARANQLARYLRDLGVGPDTLTGICMQRSPEMIVALLAILKAGGAYVPLDPDYPQERLAFMMEDARMNLLLTEEKLARTLPSNSAALICPETKSAELGMYSPENLGVDLSADNLAYAMYTSGSTGRPKAIAIPHRGVMRLVKGSDFARMGPEEVFLQFAPISFDASTFEIWGSLLNGARLVIMPQGIPSLEEIGQVIRQYEVTTAWLTAGLFHQMVDRNLEGLRPLRQLLAGGDVLQVEEVRKVLGGSKEARVINGYGPTESTTFACCHPMGHGYELGQSVPIGRPISNTQVYLLDERLEPVPVGVSGELYIGGDGLARGYLDRPELTAERFIPDPHGRRAGGRLYRTGDLARYKSNGEIEFIGRTDDQVKVRGYRIEPGEIETALASHEGVRQALVIARQDSPSDKRLVAYVMAGDGDMPAVEELRDFLKKRLPDYMVPSAFVLMDEFPLNPNGKVDRAALPVPDAHRPDLEQKLVPPRTPVEELIAGVWSEVLGLSRMGIHEDFFILGGHSLMATQVISRINEAFNITLPLRTLFELPTIAQMSEAVEAEMNLGAGTQRPPIVPAPREGLLPLSFAQQRMWVFDQLVPGSDVYNVPFAVRLTGSLNVEAFERTLNEIIRRHESLRTTFDTVGGRPAQIVADRLEVSLPLVDLSELREREQTEEARRIASEHNHRPFDLTRGPLIRVCMVRLSEREHVALVNMHHIISDGWSIGVLHGEIVTLYEAFVAGQPSPLKDPAIQYPDFAVWEREWLEGGVMELQLSYWKEKLSGAPPVLDLPTDKPRPPAQTFNGGSLSRHLPRPTLDALREVSRRNGVTLFMTILAAYDALLHFHTGRTDIVVGTDIANRGRVEVEELIGFFANQLALRVDLSGDPPFAELQRRARETALGAYANQDVPFDKLLEALKPNRIPGRSPLFQVKLVHQNARKSELSISGLTTARFDSDVDVAKFDLLLNVMETDEGLINTLFYNKDLFERAKVERMLMQFDMILLAAVAQPEITLSALAEMLSEAERQQQETKRDEFKEARRKMLKDLKSRTVKAPRAKGEVGL